MSVDSDHINYLILRYLQESGFQHSSFTFGQESGITRCSVAGVKIPPGSLIAHLQRALNYVQAEVSLCEDGRPADLEDLDTIDALTLIESVQPEVCEQRRLQLNARARERKQEFTSTAHVSEPMEADVEIPPSKVKILRGHEKEVVTVAWNPVSDIIASGSGDSTARIWSVENKNSLTVVEASCILRHIGVGVTGDEDSKDVTTLDWNPQGTLLATGSYDGTGRIWTKDGELQNRLIGHEGPIFSLKWNRLGDHLVTSSVDKCAIVWEPRTGQILQIFKFHVLPCLDVDWKSDTVFASCSTDMVIYVCKIGSAVPIMTFNGHEDEVNAIKWDVSGSLLASCSDDCTVKIWNMESDTAMQNLVQGDKIYSLNWSRPPSADNNLPLMLASASFDNTTKVWDVRAGTCLYTLTGHTLPVYSVDFSPNCRYLASGSFDNCLLIWSMETGELVQSYHGGGGIFEVCWNKAGDKVAACFSDNTLAVVDFRP